ncbi:hypothetical protein PDESU_01892 [Pontiella desulfatans]|uniref:Uncharacterized protein n=1 Tax=Pontiella desulfatans TaxID=2750659 RepID=A0A6C2U1S4_PONDE|nr:family 43 glycosylhydrolase [Pontiella desulfatans]VGO13336.1 hypothetical protein PDESU_01892 [Pontiella desulfatans]
MNRISIFAVCALFCGFHMADAGVLTSEQKLEKVKAHNEAFQALNEKVRDPFVLKGPDGFFYMTGTTAGTSWGETAGIKIWKSRDLAEWKDLGFVWELERDGKDDWFFDVPLKRTGPMRERTIWAPEIHCMNGTWWVPLSANTGGHSLLKSTTGRIEGPYDALPLMDGPHNIDSHLYEENGEVYYCYQADFIAKMKPDMSGLAEEKTKLKHKGNHPLGYEGILMLKIGDKYLHIASGRYGYEPTDTYDLYYTVSKNLYGPYGKRRMALKNAGHGNLFQDHEGRWWSTAFDHEFFTEGMQNWSLWLVPVEIEETEDDLIIRSKDPRFQPSEDDQRVVEELSKTGPPAAWKGKARWWRPEGK